MEADFPVLVQRLKKKRELKESSSTSRKNLCPPEGQGTMWPFVTKGAKSKQDNASHGAQGIGGGPSLSAGSSDELHGNPQETDSSVKEEAENAFSELSPFSSFSPSSDMLSSFSPSSFSPSRDPLEDFLKTSFSGDYPFFGIASAYLPMDRLHQLASDICNEEESLFTSSSSGPNSKKRTHTSPFPDSSPVISPPQDIDADTPTQSYESPRNSERRQTIELYRTQDECNRGVMQIPHGSVGKRKRQKKSHGSTTDKENSCPPHPDDPGGLFPKQVHDPFAHLVPDGSATSVSIGLVSEPLFASSTPYSDSER